MTHPPQGPRQDWKMLAPSPGRGAHSERPSHGATPDEVAARVAGKWKPREEGWELPWVMMEICRVRSWDGYKVVRRAPTCQNEELNPAKVREQLGITAGVVSLLRGKPCGEMRRCKPGTKLAVDWNTSMLEALEKLAVAADDPLHQKFMDAYAADVRRCLNSKERAR